MKTYKYIAKILCRLLLGLFVLKANSAEFTSVVKSEWDWGVSLDPHQKTTQAAMLKTPYHESDIPKIPVLDLSSEADSTSPRPQVQCLKLEVARLKPRSFSKACPFIETFSNTTFQFNLTRDYPVLTEIANDPRNRGIFAAPARGEKPRDGEQTLSKIYPISDITLPQYKAHGAVISLFRYNGIDSNGKAGGRIVVGTGFLSSPSCVITAGHNVVLDMSERGKPTLEDLNPYAERVEFWPLLNGFTPDMFDGEYLKDAATRAESVKVHPKWNTQGKERASYDIAVLKLTTPIGYEYGCCAPQVVTPYLQDTDNLDEIDTFVSGYAASTEDISFLINECKGTLVEPYHTKNRAFYSVSPITKEGQSGGGIRFFRNGKHVMVGAHTELVFDSRGDKKGSGGTAFSESIYDNLKEWIMGYEQPLKATEKK